MVKPADETICYRFHHTRSDIEKDLKRNGRSLILEKIIDAKRLGACQCAVKNPKGTCCLADVRRVLDEASR